MCQDPPPEVLPRSPPPYTFRILVIEAFNPTVFDIVSRCSKRSAPHLALMGTWFADHASSINKVVSVRPYCDAVSIEVEVTKTWLAKAWTRSSPAIFAGPS